MRIVIAFLIALTIWAQGDAKKPAKAAPVTMTGCLDQRGEVYFLSDEKDMTKKTDLRAKGFKDDNFARYVGHKVAVTGSMAADVFEVTKIEEVAPTCSR